MTTKPCGLCGSPHGPYDSCLLFPSPHYAWCGQWLTEHPREGGKYEYIFVVPVSGPEEASLVVGYAFAHGLMYAGAKPTAPYRSGKNEVVQGAGGWTIVYRWCPSILAEAYHHAATYSRD